MALAVGKQIGLNCEALILVDKDTGRRTQLPLSENAGGVGLSTATSVYCSRTAEPDHSLPDTNFWTLPWRGDQSIVGGIGSSIIYQKVIGCEFTGCYTC